MARHDEAPIILPLSNPSDRTEATPEDVLEWTDGRALIATGSPFAPVTRPGGPRTIGQANNVFIFPGVGLAAIVAEAREPTDDSFLVAAHELARQVSPERLAAGVFYPPISDLRPVARAIAIRLVRHARDSGYGRQFRDEEIEPAVDRAMWWPAYPELQPGWSPPPDRPTTPAGPSKPSFGTRDISSATACMGARPAWTTASTCSAMGSSTACSAARLQRPTHGGNAFRHTIQLRRGIGP